ncbi:glycine betaine ABC transporter substrate-binding protein [Isachenkonia alkalipeptolytica]|uniref:Glycine/betaine ABC transporter substrate-binding protein n=1 Tax=Isachenkonia alkalipeptolytica TaxID=2565777 RepID=A0AA44BFE0_9CLOT|nr:glycine betaine ABC transporter substrate-binding protein [Isachenkonia alkalipeptolytica]NBG88451.1 glycine/betaine ABC transporter substrate-binding protein [Isachenkonia alkalipeptolytica]
MKKKLILGVLLITVLLFTACGNDEGEEAAEISFGVTPWTSTVPPTEVASLIIQEMGYEVSYMETDAAGVYMGLAGDDNDIFMDGWIPAHEVYFETYEDEVESISISYDEAEQGWVVPEYMEDINSIEDILGNEELFNNEMYSIEDGASITEVIDELIEGYGLEMTQVNSSEAAMIAQVMRNMENEEPVVFYGWRPHTMFRNLDIKLIDDDRGYFEESSVHVVVDKKLQEKAPDVYAFLENWSIDIGDVEQMIVEIEDEGRDPEEVAQEWIDNNQEKVDEMINN